MYRSAPSCRAWRARGPRSRCNGCRKSRDSRMQCAEAMRVQAYFDAEVDALSAADIERHIEHCAECRALLNDLEQVRGVLRRDLGFARTPPALRAKIMQALDEEGAAEKETPAATP